MNIVWSKHFSEGEDKKMADNIVQLSDENFDTEALNSSTPVLVDFWAPWCGPCRMIAPELEKLAGEKSGSLVIGKLNVDENRDTAIKYSVSAIPTMILFKDGKAQKTLVGAMSKDSILDEISSLI